MTQLFWHYGGGQDVAPYSIEVGRAADVRAACALFAVEWPSVRVHVLTSPKVIARVRGLGEGCVIALSVPRLPSVYDEFEISPGRWDYDAMEDRGFRVD
jgi:hypothetical protein